MSNLSPELREAPPSAESTAQFLSAITGLPITRQSLFPELGPETNVLPGQPSYPHTFELVLGERGDQYRVSCNIAYSNEDTSDQYIPNVQWSVRHNGKKLYGTHYSTISFGQIIDEYDPETIQPHLETDLQHAVGGPNTEVIFMDYEDAHTLEGFKTEGYFANIYLVLMTHMKARGLALPPILSKDTNMQEAIARGDIEWVNELLSASIAYGEAHLEPRCVAHMKYEAQVIRRETRVNQQKLDPFLPLEAGFPDMPITNIAEGEARFGSPTILSVENRLEDMGAFPDAVIDALNADGRFKGAKVVQGFSIGDVIELSKTGKINLVVFDQLDPDEWELLYVQGARNPLYELFHGNTQAVISIDEDGLQFNLADGRLLDPEGMEGAIDEVDTRAEWMQIVEQECAKLGIQPPKHIVIRSRKELAAVADAIAKQIGRPQGK